MFSSCTKQESFKIVCNLRSLSAPSQYAILTHTNPYNGVKDTLAKTKSQNGIFTFTGKVDYPKMCQIEISQHKLNLFVENNDISITGSIQMPEEIVVEGSNSHTDWATLLKKERQIDYARKQLLIEIVKAQKNNDDFKRMKELETEHKSYADSLKNIISEQVKKNPSSFGTTYFLYYTIVNEIYSAEELKDIFYKLDSETLLGSESYMFISEMIALSKGISVHEKAYPFNIGDTVTLSQYKGKKLYLYFTATWCDSCKAFTKELERIYELNKNKDFEILSMYLDYNDSDWDYSLTKKNSKWNIACDKLYWHSPITKMYGVNEIPYGVLIDRTGLVWSVNPTLTELTNLINR